jgi:flagellar biosynthesis protein FliR
MAPILFSTAEIIRFAIVLTRISGIMLMAPFFGNQMFPVSIRVVFTLMSAFILAPSLPLKQIPVELDLSNVVTLLVGEILVGLILGFAAMCVMAGLQFAGQIISFQLGFAVINAIDPQSNVQSPVFSLLYNYLGLLFFLLINGHHWFLLAINDSFSYLSIGGIQIHGALAGQIVGWSAHILDIGIRIAGPILAVTVITDILMGVISRTAPQINILIVGMPLKLLVGFGCLSFSLYFLPRYLGNEYSILSQTLLALVHKN